MREAPVGACVLACPVATAPPTSGPQKPGQEGTQGVVEPPIPSGPVGRTLAEYSESPQIRIFFLAMVPMVLVWISTHAGRIHTPYFLRA